MLPIIVAISERIKDFFHAVNNKDLHLMDHFYTEDACIVPPGKPVTCSGNKINISTYKHIYKDH